MARKHRGSTQRSVMRHDFSTVPSANISRSAFNMSHGHKSTLDKAGILYPIYLQEVVPGDTHSVTANVFLRLATPIHPIMDNMYAETFFFFTPNRLVHDNWVRLMGEQDNPGDSVDFTTPKLRGSGSTLGGMLDYMGLPINLPGQANDMNATAYPCRGYNLIWNTWFRSEDLQNSAVVEKGDNEVGTHSTNYPLRERGKRHDYFTSCLPWPQKDFGEPVLLPLGQTAPIFSPGNVTDEVIIKDGQGAGAGNYDFATGSGTALLSTTATTPENLFADLQNATAATINDLRQAFQIQKLQERDARGGTRYQELVLAHFGVRGGDARLQRPEYLGGGTHPVGITAVPQTSETAATPQGNLSAYGTSFGKSGFTKSFTEHGYILGLIAIRADLTYQRGIDRHWSRTTKHDFYFPALARLGEQAVPNREIYADGSANDDLIFGYQERWAEMRFNQSKITGKFRSAGVPSSLDVWHLSQDFASLPVLGDVFIRENPPVERVIAVATEPHFLMDAFFQQRSVRPMPISSAPGYIDHF